MSFLDTVAAFDMPREKLATLIILKSPEFERRVDYLEARTAQLEVYMLDAAKAVKASDHVSVMQALALYQPMNQLAKHSLDHCLMDAEYITTLQAKVDKAVKAEQDKAKLDQASA